MGQRKFERSSTESKGETKQQKLLAISVRLFDMALSNNKHFNIVLKVRKGVKNIETEEGYGCLSVIDDKKLKGFTEADSRKVTRLVILELIISHLIFQYLHTHTHTHTYTHTHTHTYIYIYISSPNATRAKRT